MSDLDEPALTALVRQSHEPTEAEESRAAVVRLADEVRRLRRAIETHHKGVLNQEAQKADRELWEAIKGPTPKPTDG